MECPPVPNLGAAGPFRRSSHRILRCFRRFIDALQRRRIELSGVERLTRDNTEFLHFLDHRRVFLRRRIALEQRREAREERAPIHLGYLLGCRRFDVDARGRRSRRRCRCTSRSFAEARQRRQSVLILQLVHRGVVTFSADLRAAVQQHHFGRRFDFLDAWRKRSLPARADDCKVRLVGARHTLAERRENIRPTILRGEQIIAAVHVGNREHEGFLRQVQPRRRQQHVRIRVDRIGRARIG